MGLAPLLRLLSVSMPLPFHLQLLLPPTSLQLLLLLPFPTEPALCHWCGGLLMPLRRCHLRCHCRCRVRCRCRYYPCCSCCCCCCCRCCRAKRQAPATISDAVCPFDHGARERAFHAGSAGSRIARFDHSPHRPFNGGFGSRESRCCCADYSQSSKNTRHRLQLRLLCARTFHRQGGRELL